MLLVDARGVPLSIIVTAANRHDITQLVPTLDAVVVSRPAVAPRTRQHLCADAGFIGAAAMQDMRNRDYTPHVRPRGDERTQRAQGKRPRRWVVEVAHSLVHPISQTSGSLREAASLLPGVDHARRRYHQLPPGARKGQHYLRISS